MGVIYAQVERGCAVQDYPPSRVVRLDDLHQDPPGHHAFQVFEKLALARLLGGEIRAVFELLHGRHRRRAQPPASRLGFS